ncbi:Hydrolase, alpha/beta fold family functionally coupled to Phosphoribulokinase [hydrothermal vent metagenome]|uniref:Hydrolase, alpha/beta fold family functionally coupled to Phosphoribulokinase n=1 Tax=hydrothermal vent metagenome TaxID=652676 RepID=A0A1W1D5W4_9ZZZZ
MKFSPAFSNAHLQTLYAPLFRKKITLPLEKERFFLEDGDFVECYWHNKPSIASSKPIIVLLHGLNGSYQSPYIQGIMKEASLHNFASVVMHFRGCSGVQNNLPRAYHSGDTKDILAWIKHLHSTYFNATFFGVGYSLGGNVLLKLLGEEKENIVFQKAVSISAPLDLAISANAINKGFSKFYQRLLLKDLKKMLHKKFQKHPMNKYIKLQQKEIAKIKTFWEFDEAYTAPIHHFQSAKEYYQKSSAKPYLKDIAISTLLIHSLDDPFMTPKILPKKEEINDNITLEVYPYGGHVGFVSGTIFRPNYWLEKRIISFFIK